MKRQTKRLQLSVETVRLLQRPLDNTELAQAAGGVRSATGGASCTATTLVM